ncbi:uncharacterized protein LOC113003090 [Solenopsis invicta]|uniref:uncharacterized protein LOC113003090 n=1 Tax=Solenopsis invicta TaxID=13686 RepID=UPI00193D145B|nr:uncharacterized protein LOC113003090 [Solenopsis invicta]
MRETVHVQVKDNSPSIERILRPITYISWLLGVGVAHPRKCPKAITIIIRIIYMAVCSYVMISDRKFIFPFPLFPEYFVYTFPPFHIINKIMCCVSVYYCIYPGIREYNKWPELMDRLKELDQNIKKEISMNDRSIKIVEALAIFTTFTFCPLITIIQALYYLPHLLQIDVSLLYYILLAQLMINSFIFVVIVYILYCRFQAINKLICQLDKLSDVQWIAFKIRRIRELHTGVCDLASMVNDIYGFNILFCSGNCFTMAITSLYYLFNFLPYCNCLRLIQYFLCIVYFMQFGLICWICTLACEESNRTGSIMHKVILNCQPMNLDNNEASNQSSLEMRSALEDLNNEQNSNCSSSHNPYIVENFLRKNLDLECVTEEVNDFSTQLQHNRVAFTAYNFFEINNISFGCVSI